MSLQSKYLPTFDIAKTEQIQIAAPAEVVFKIVEELDFSSSRVIRCLFRLRGLPVPQSLTMRGLEMLNFIRLESIRNEEMIIGLIGQFWTPTGRLKKFRPEEFISFDDQSYAKGTWSFTLSSPGLNLTMLSTETRVLCVAPKAKRWFRLYWTFIGPFSTWIRREVLKGVKAKAESIHAQFVI